MCQSRAATGAGQDVGMKLQRAAQCDLLLACTAHASGCLVPWEHAGDKGAHLPGAEQHWRGFAMRKSSRG